MKPPENLTLAQLRKSSTHTVEAVALHMGVTRRAIYRWEKGDRELTAANLWRLLDFYGHTEIPISQIPFLIPTIDTSPTD